MKKKLNNLFAPGVHVVHDGFRRIKIRFSFRIEWNPKSL